MALLIFRLAFVVVTAGLATLVFRSDVMPADAPAWIPWLVFVGTLALAGGTIAADILYPQKRIDTISGIYFGLLIGLVLTSAVSIALAPLLDGPTMQPFREVIQIGIGLFVCYICVSLLLQTKDDFRFIIPYVEFSKEVKGAKPYILDTSVVIDGRIADLVECEILDNQLIMPRFVLAELQAIADSSDKMKRSRGRRGLDILDRLRKNERVDIKFYDRELPESEGQPVDMKLVLLAKSLNGKIVTGDYNLNKVSRLHNVGVINLNDVANALKPVYLPGETFEVRLVKPGESAGQGVGYLDDGTMIVVEGGRDQIGQQVLITVTSVLQTSAGRMIFGRYEQTISNKSTGKS